MNKAIKREATRAYRVNGNRRKCFIRIPANVSCIGDLNGAKHRTPLFLCRIPAYFSLAISLGFPLLCYSFLKCDQQAFQSVDHAHLFGFENKTFATQLSKDLLFQNQPRKMFVHAFFISREKKAWGAQSIRFLTKDRLASIKRNTTAVKFGTVSTIRGCCLSRWSSTREAPSECPHISPQLSRIPRQR